jgi:hypothetical protein
VEVWRAIPAALFGAGGLVVVLVAMALLALLHVN